ncbi:MAG: S8 family serine peptidase [Patescibacteria group bacterium]|nr:S8 family serine peptidase [Patescibacteria group bacterium]
MLEAHRHGVISVVAAGNMRSEVQSFPAFFSRFSTQPDYRLGLSSVITVGAVNDEGNISPFSNRGWFIDLYAPGGQGDFPWGKRDILSTFPTYGVVLNDTTRGLPYQTEYAYLAGTSMATPFVVGTVSLMMGVTELTPDAIKEILMVSADSIRTIEGTVLLLNPGKAVQRAVGISTPVARSETKTSPNTFTFSLSQNFPNPFNPETTIRYQLSQATQVTLKVYNLLGEEVATLEDEKKPAGSYKVHWNANDLSIPSGIYFYKLTAGDFTEVKKMTLVK